jgi:hypothetical protein
VSSSGLLYLPANVSDYHLCVWVALPSCLCLRLCARLPGVGKTCLMKRFIDDMFTTSYQATIGIDFKTKDVKVGERVVKIQVRCPSLPHPPPSFVEARVRPSVLTIPGAPRGLSFQAETRGRCAMSLWARLLSLLLLSTPTTLLPWCGSCGTQVAQSGTGPSQHRTSEERRCAFCEEARLPRFGVRVSAPTSPRPSPTSLPPSVSLPPAPIHTIVVYTVLQGMLVAFDVTNRDSFENVERWITDIQQACILALHGPSREAVEGALHVRACAQPFVCSFVRLIRTACPMTPRQLLHCTPFAQLRADSLPVLLVLARPPPPPPPLLTRTHSGLVRNQTKQN